MPKAQSALPTDSRDTKPYHRSSTPSTPSNNPPTDASAPTTHSPARKGKSWTSVEKLALFDVAMKKGASTTSFDGVVPGRSGKVAYDTWMRTLVPTLRRSLGSK